MSEINVIDMRVKEVNKYKIHFVGRADSTTKLDGRGKGKSNSG